MYTTHVDISVILYQLPTITVNVILAGIHNTICIDNKTESNSVPNSFIL